MQARKSFAVEVSRNENFSVLAALDFLSQYAQTAIPKPVRKTENDSRKNCSVVTYGHDKQLQGSSCKFQQRYGVKEISMMRKILKQA